MRKNLAKSKVKILKKKLINTAFLLIFSVIAVATYYTANFSKAKDIIEVNVEIKNALNMDKSANLDLNTTEGSNGDTFYIRLPQYIENKKVTKYSYYTTETEAKSENKQETDKTLIDELGPNDVLPDSKIYLTTTEIREKKLTIIAHYDTKEVNGNTYYNKLLTQQKNDTTITASGYMPENSELKVEDVDLKSVQSKIRKQATKPVILAVAYDIKIQSEGKDYEPYQIDQSVNINIEKESLKTKDVNIWHIKEDDQIEKIEDNTTNSFSIFGLEDAEATALAIDGMAESVLTIDDAESDKYYWMGQNYTDDTTGSNKNIYTAYANVTLNYHAYANEETDPEMIGYVSLTERYNVITYKKTAPIVNGNISIELVDNPFNDRPTGYGFGGWVSNDGTITKDSKTNTQTITLTGSNNITINVYTNWKEANVVYVNPDTGNDNLNSGLTTEEPFGSWGAAFNYLYNNSSNRSDRENNIIVLTGNIDSSPNYTRDVTTTNQTVKKGEVYYTNQGSINDGDTYIVSMGTDSSSYALMGEGGAESGRLSSTDIPNDYYMWKFVSYGNYWRIQNIETQKYLIVGSGKLALSSTPSNWTYDNGILSTISRKWMGN